MTINGNLTATNGSLYADGAGSTVTVNGNVTINGEQGSVNALGGEMTITGNVTVNATGDEEYNCDASVLADGANAKLSIGGNVTVTSASGKAWTNANNNSEVTIDGNVTVTGNADWECADVYVYGDGTMSIGGNVIVTAKAGEAYVYIQDAGELTIDGNVTVNAPRIAQIGIWDDVGELRIGGNVVSPQGVYLFGGGLVVIDGTLNVADTDKVVEYFAGGSGSEFMGLSGSVPGVTPFVGYQWFDTGVGDLYVKGAISKISSGSDGGDNTMFIIGFIVGLLIVAAVIVVYFMFIKKK
jgi:hypothetical protein